MARITVAAVAQDVAAIRTEVSALTDAVKALTALVTAESPAKVTARKPAKKTAPAKKAAPVKVAAPTKGSQTRETLTRKQWNATLSAKARFSGGSTYKDALARWSEIQDLRNNGATPDEALFAISGLGL